MHQPGRVAVQAADFVQVDSRVGPVSQHGLCDLWVQAYEQLAVLGIECMAHQVERGATWAAVDDDGHVGHAYQAGFDCADVLAAVMPADFRHQPSDVVPHHQAVTVLGIELGRQAQPQLLRQVSRRRCRENDAIGASQGNQALEQAHIVRAQRLKANKAGAFVVAIAIGHIQLEFLAVAALQAAK